MTLLFPFLQLFARPWFLPVALLLAIVIGTIGWRADARRRARLAQLGDLPVLERLVPRTSPGMSPRLRAVLLGTATLLLGLALAGPRWGERAENRRDLGVDIALVLDVSASMLARDEGDMSRLDRMKGDVRRLLATMPAARAALMVVAGRAYLLTPLTADHDALELFLDGLDPGMVSQGGTAIAEGVDQATKLLGVSQEGGDRALVLMSDGETWDDQGAVEAAATAARDAHVAVVTVGYGSAQGATIPVAAGTVKRDENGQPVITKANAVVLSAIARITEGVYIAPNTPDRPGRVRTALRRLRQTERVYNAGSSPIQRYEWFLWPAFVLLLIDALFAEYTRRARPALAAGVLACVLALPARTQAQGLSGARPADGIALYKQRKFVDAARAFRERGRNGDVSLRNMFNLGTALLEADSVAAATELLDRVVTIAPDADLRYRALFNLGLANLRRARKASPNEAGAFYSAAVAAYKRALRTRTDDADAKWNLELATREQQRNAGGGGGGGGGQQPPPPQQQPANSRQQQELDKQRADAVLNSAARDERDVQSKRQRDGRPREVSNGRDW